MNSVKCQMQSKDMMHEGRPQPVLLSFRTRLIMTLASPLNPSLKRFIKQRLSWFNPRQAGRNQPVKDIPKAAVKIEDKSLKAGDLVRIRSINEIKATLNSDNRLKGCKFMPEMEQYCGTTQRVFKPVERFLNERDYTLRKSSSLVLLENLFCQGFAEVGRCDRSCFYFWRVEWLEHLDEGG